MATAYQSLFNYSVINNEVKMLSKFKYIQKGTDLF